MATEFSSGETTIGALVNLRGDIARLRGSIEPDTSEDCLHTSSGDVLIMLDEVIEGLSNRARDKRMVQVRQREFEVINSAILVAKALGFFHARAMCARSLSADEQTHGVLQRLH